MLVLVLLAVYATATAIERIARFKKQNIIPDAFSEQAAASVRSGNSLKIQQLCQQHPSTLSRAVAYIDSNKEDDDLDAVIQEAAEQVQRELRGELQKAHPFSVVATSSPLIGLFGTVYGMIISFDKVALAGELGDPKILASGISMALITTAAGLLIAIPSLALSHYFKGRINGYALAIEQELTQLQRIWVRQKRAS